MDGHIPPILHSDCVLPAQMHQTHPKATNANETGHVADFRTPAGISGVNMSSAQGSKPASLMLTMMMRSLLVLIVWLGLLAGAAAQSLIGIYLGDVRIGYSESQSFEEGEGRRVESSSRISTRSLGADLEIISTATSWYNADGRLVRMESRQESGGRVTEVRAEFTDDQVIVISEQAGQVTERRLPIPDDAPIVEDVSVALIEGHAEVGQSTTFYVLDTNTLALIKVTARIAGTRQIEFEGQMVQATQVTVDDPRAPTETFFSAKGDFLMAEGPLGMRMVREQGENREIDRTEVDLAEISTIRLEGDIRRPLNYRQAVYVLRGVDAQRLPNDPHQQVETASEGEMRVTIEPQRSSSSRTIAEVGAMQPDWIAEEALMPVGAAELQAVVDQVVGDETQAVRAAQALRRHVFGELRVNAGIGVLRDAREVLSSSEGVCRDHAILLAALLRTAGIPARLVSGLIADDNRFYYHAWVEFFDGEAWVGIDSTRGGEWLTVTHLVVRRGTLEEAYTGFLLRDVTIALERLEPVRPTN